MMMMTRMIICRWPNSRQRLSSRAFYLATALAAASLSGAVLAQVLIDPAAVTPSTATGAYAAGAFAVSEVEYENGGIDDDIERTILGVEFSRAANESIDLVGQVGWITETEVEDYDPDGSGFTLGGGMRGVVQREESHHVAAYGIFTYQKESIDSGNVEINFSTYDLHVGGALAFHASPTATPYAGLDIVILSDGKGEVEVNGRTVFSDTDVERESRVSLKLGVGIAIGKATFRPEVTVFGEDTLTLSVGTTF